MVGMEAELTCRRSKGILLLKRKGEQTSTSLIYLALGDCKDEFSWICDLSLSPYFPNGPHKRPYAHPWQLVKQLCLRNGKKLAGEDCRDGFVGSSWQRGYFVKATEGSCPDPIRSQDLLCCILGIRSSGLCSICTWVFNM